MGTYRIPQYSISVTSNYVVLDSNVLIAAFNPKEQYHAIAKEFIDGNEEGYQFIVTMSVVIETWGVLVGRDRLRHFGIEMLSWLITPGSGVISVPQDSSPLNTYLDMLRSIDRIDAVDIFLSHFSSDITSAARVDPEIRIATFDTAHFNACRKKFNLNFRVIDLKTNDTY